MTREEYIEDIKISLGAPIVDVEIESLLGSIVDQAFREIRRYVVDTRFITVPYSDKGIDVSEYNINTVIGLVRTNNPSRVFDFTDIYSLSTLNTAYTSSSNLLLSDYLYRTQLNQIKSTISTDLDFTFDRERQILHVNTFYPKPSSITIIYNPNFKDVSEIKEPYWEGYIQRFALALSKITLGRVRGKYELSSSLYKLDGSELLQEGIAERDAIRQELKEDHDLVLPMD